MPHFTIEYSANLDRKVDVPGLCEAIRKAALETGMFNEGGIRVRAIRCDAYAVADAHPDNAFVDIAIKVAEGRPLETRKAAGEAIFDVVSAYLAALLEAPHFALSMQMREMDPQTSWKKNSIHPRLRGGEAS